MYLPGIRHLVGKYSHPDKSNALTCWKVCGYEGVKHLADLRENIVSSSEHEISDAGSFYTIICDEQARPVNAILRRSVQEWIAELHQKPRCSKFVQEFLDLISKRMLVVNPGGRITAETVNSELSDMARSGEKNESYFTLERNEGLRIPQLVMKEVTKSPKLSPLPTAGNPLPECYERV